MNFVLTDAGRHLYKPKQRNDCSVRALATAFNISYKEAFEYCQRLGRPSDGAWCLPWWLVQIEKRGISLWGKTIKTKHFPEKRNDSRPTVAKFLKKYRFGSMIIHVKGHVLCVKEGAVYDDQKWDLDKLKVYRVFFIHS